MCERTSTEPRIACVNDWLVRSVVQTKYGAKGDDLSCDDNYLPDVEGALSLRFSDEEVLHRAPAERSRNESSGSFVISS